MSKYGTATTQFTQACHDKPVHLYGYLGDARPETAEIVLRRFHIGRGSNDVGFKLGADGTYPSYHQRVRFPPVRFQLARPVEPGLRRVQIHRVDGRAGVYLPEP